MGYAGFGGIGLKLDEKKNASTEECKRENIQKQRVEVSAVLAIFSQASHRKVPREVYVCTQSIERNWMGRVQRQQK